MAHITLADGSRLFVVERGAGQPVIFSHGWPVDSDSWAHELEVFAAAGYRAIAYDRRGHGRSDPAPTGTTMDEYVADLAGLVDRLQLDDLLLVGHGVGGGEVVRFAARHGAGRVRKIATVGSVAPIMVASDGNPEGTPRETFDLWRASLRADPRRFWDAIAAAYVGDALGDAEQSAVAADVIRQATRADPVAAAAAIASFSETDFAADLEALDVPVFIAHGEDDRLVPPAASEKAITRVVRGTLKLYPAGPHGVLGAFRTALDDDILAFFSS